MKTMHADTLLQFMRDESEEWDRLLNFLKQENVFCKSRLADLAASIDDEDDLAKAEKFNDEFISEDEIIGFLESELKKHRRNLERNRHHDEELFKQLNRQQKKLRMDIRRAEEIIIITRRDFSDYIVDLV